MFNAQSLPVTQEAPRTDFNRRLGMALFSDPMRDHDNAVVVANWHDEVAKIRAGDLVRVDFTARQLGEGLYVITLDDNWIGYRRFQRMPDLRIVDGTESIPVTSEMLRSIKVVGKVKDIYRSIK